MFSITARSRDRKLIAPYLFDSLVIYWVSHRWNVHTVLGRSRQSIPYQMKGIEEAVVELEAEADKVEIRRRPAAFHEEIAEVLLQAEAA